MYRRYSGKDRRRYQRLDLDIMVIYRVDQPLYIRLWIGDKEIEATMLDLSVGGIALLTGYNIPVWTKLFIKFSLSRMDKQGLISLYGPMEIKGEVRSNILSEENKYRLGICFIEIDDKDKKEIADFVRTTLAIR